MISKKFFFLSFAFSLITSSSSFAQSPLPGMPPVLDTKDIYSADRPNQLAPSVQGIKELVYVPNHSSNTLSIIDPATFKVIKTLKT